MEPVADSSAPPRLDPASCSSFASSLRAAHRGSRAIRFSAKNRLNRAHTDDISPRRADRAINGAAAVAQVAAPSSNVGARVALSCG
jgi:hypothetical protein